MSDGGFAMNEPVVQSIHAPSCPGEYRPYGRGIGGYWTGCDCDATTATVERVSPNPKRVLSPEDETSIRFAMHVRDAANEYVRRAVLDAASHGASVRVLAEFTGMSTNTISRWKADARE